MRNPTNMVELKKLNRPNDQNSNVLFEVESIDKDKALEYLSLNFDNNRRLKGRSVEKLVYAMKNNNFHLSWDCIAFNEDGQLVNGQHRLAAIVEADVTCKFHVLRNINHSTIKHFDIGTSRSQADRISIHGTPMHAKACAVVKLAFSDWNANHTATGKLSASQFDDQIASYYSRHSDYFERLEADGYMQAKYTNNASAAAFKIFLEMKVGRGRFTDYAHGMDAYERSTYFLDLVINGKSKDRTIDYNFDQAPFKLNEKLIGRRGLGKTMYGAVAYKYYLVAANSFMNGRSPLSIRIDGIKNDPFSNFRGIPSSNT